MNLHFWLGRISTRRENSGLTFPKVVHIRADQAETFNNQLKRVTFHSLGME